MLQPKRTKYRRAQKGRTRGIAQRGATVSFGDYGIKTLEAGWITSRQIEAARIAMTRRMKRVGKVWIRIFPDKPITRKPAETRMGSGKGAPEGFVAPVKPGRVLFEVGGVTEELAREAMALAMQKLPVRTRFVVRPEVHTVAPTAKQLGMTEAEADARAAELARVAEEAERARAEEAYARDRAADAERAAAAAAAAAASETPDEEDVVLEPTAPHSAADMAEDQAPDEEADAAPEEQA
jgi:large subunit ribosomal protein L16